MGAALRGAQAAFVMPADCPTGFLAVGAGHEVTGYVDALAYRSKALDADTWIVIGHRSLTSLGDPYLRSQGTYLRAEPAGSRDRREEQQVWAGRRR